jgi:hypothetical protein
MTAPSASSSFWWALALVGSSAACVTPRMKVPVESNRDSDAVAVDGLPMWRGALFKEDFKIGEDRVVHISRGAESQTRFRTFLGFESNQQDSYFFDVTQAGEMLHGECAVAASESGAKLGKVTLHRQASRIGCACGDSSGGRVNLATESSNSEGEGTISAAGVTYRVAEIHDLEGGGWSSPVAGYRIDGDHFVGAVDVLRPGHVWLDQPRCRFARGPHVCIRGASPVQSSQSLTKGLGCPRPRTHLPRRGDPSKVAILACRWIRYGT